MDVTNEVEAIHNAVWGSNPTNSYLYVPQGTRGWSYQNNIEILNTYKTGDIIQELDWLARTTDNRQIDPDEHYSTQQFYYKMDSPHFFMQAGDLFVNFSQYSLTQNLKGGILTLKDQNKDLSWDVNAVGGVYKNRWEFLWMDKLEETKDTYFYGTRVGGGMDLFQAHLNYVYTDEYRLKDREPGDNYAGNMTRQTTDIDHAHVGSIDWELRPLSGIYFSGESAISYDHVSAPGTLGVQIDQGSAHKIMGRGRIKNVRAQIEYERVPPNFHTPGGSASTDREKYRVNGKYYWGPSEIFVNYTSYMNNLKKRLTTTTKTTEPETGLVLRNLLNRKTLASGLDWRRRMRWRTDGSMDDRTDTLTFFVEDKIGSLSPRFEYEFRRFDPTKDPNDSGERTHTFTWSANAYQRIGDFVVRPNGSLMYEENNDLGQDPTGRGINKTWLWSAALSLDYKEYLRFNLAYNFNQADNYGVNTGTRRKVFGGALEYMIGGSRDNVVSAEYQKRTNEFSDENNDYIEDEWRLRYLRRF